MTKVTLLVSLSTLLLSLNGCSTAPITNNPYTTTSPNDPNKPVVALVLGGGGARGIAHVGVIKALAANGIYPDLIVGTSAGSLVGSLYASGKTSAELEHLALVTREDELADFTLSSQGVIEGTKLKNFVNAQVANRRIEQLPIRFAAIATEKHTHKKTVFTQGDTGLVVQASSSVPSLFIAPRIPEKVGTKYVDGGVSSLVPVDSARALGADVVIAVDVLATQSNHSDKPANYKLTTQNITSSISKLLNGQIATHQQSLWALIEQSYAQNESIQNGYLPKQLTSALDFQSVNHKNAEAQRADILITPEIGHISVFNTIPREELIAAGEQAAQQKMAAIQQHIADASSKKSNPTH